MRTLDAAFYAAHAATVTRPLILVEIGFSTPARLCSWGDVNWGGQVWLGADVRADDLSEDGSGTGAATLTIGNADNAIQALLLNERVADRPIVIYAAWLDAAGVLWVMPRLRGVGGSARSGSDKAVISVRGDAAAGMHAPRLMASAAIGWPAPKPAGAVISWNGDQYVLERRLTS